MKKTDIRKELEDLANRLVRMYAPEKIILFGSAAWGGDEIGDIDLFIVKKEVPRYGADRVLELYRLVASELPVEYIVYTPEEVEKWLSLGDPFLKKIMQEGKVLYG
jgi:predicted nucleotidyltransferase